MKQTRERFGEDWLSRVSNGFTAWVLGTGLLTLHIAIYLLASVGLLLWDLYRSPNDIAVDVTLRRWGYVVIFHAIAVGAGWVAWRLLRVDLTHAPDHIPQTPSARRQHALPLANGNVQHADFDLPARRSRDVTPVTANASTVAEEWARRWLRESMRVMSETVSVSRAALAKGNQTAPVSSDLAGPTLSEWGVSVYRRARNVMSSARGRFSTLTHLGDDSALPATPRPARDPASTWPSWKRDQLSPAPVNPDASHVDQVTAAEPVSTPPSSGSPAGVDPLRSLATIAEDTAESHDPVVDPRWTWVEAAAAAWLARREADVTPQSKSNEPAGDSHPAG